MKCNDQFQCDSLGLLGSAVPRIPGMPIDCMHRDAGSVGLFDFPQLHS